MDGLKLFVVGESSPDPEKWSEWGSRAIVAAHDEAEARSMVALPGPATEIILDRPAVLVIDSDA